MKSYRVRFSKHEHEPDNKQVTRNDLLRREKITNVSYFLLRYDHDMLRHEHDLLLHFLYLAINMS
ncbi:hypothetical protein Hanom_Chr16g01502251 [Helianthus anomalus]